jgi:hypothetical protein
MSKTKQTIRTLLSLEVNSFILTFLSLTAIADEEDVFGSDFESTDEDTEAAQQTFDAGERQVRIEERREKKVRFHVFSWLIELPSNTGNANSGCEDCCRCARAPEGDIQPRDI